MNKSLLMWLAALCNFIAAGLNYYAGVATWVTGLLLLSGVLMVVSALRERSKS